MKYEILHITCSGYNNMENLFSFNLITIFLWHHHGLFSEQLLNPEFTIITTYLLEVIINLGKWKAGWCIFIISKHESFEYDAIKSHKLY